MYSGADPGIFVRGGGGGSNHLKNFEKQNKIKKNDKKGRGEGGFSIYSAFFTIEIAL